MRQTKQPIKHVLLSDTHGQNHLLQDLPAGDVIIHCGDSLRYGSRDELREFADIFGALNYKHKILIAGNHDACFAVHPEEARHIVASRKIVYLEDSGIEINGLRYWGFPWTPVYGDWAFMGHEDFLEDKWRDVPNIDVLVTHGPPQYILDDGAGSIAHADVGISDVKLNAFGHIHDGHGSQVKDGTIYVNCALLDGNYAPAYQPIVVDLFTNYLGSSLPL